MTDGHEYQGTQAALAELQQSIQAHYPDAAFHVAPGPEDRAEIHLIVVVDLEDTDEVLDLVIERLLYFQVDEGLPIYVSPRRTVARREAMWAAHKQQGTSPLPPLGAL